MTLVRSFLFLAAILTIPSSAAADSPAQKAADKSGWLVTGNFEAKSEDGEVEYNISGIACAEPISTSRSCLVIDDELTFAQRAIVGDHRITAGEKVPLVGAAKPVGTPPLIECDGVKSAADLDGEAVAEANGFFYVIGSHGCGRSKGAYRSSSFLIARLSPENTVSVSHRISEALQFCHVIDSYFGKRLQLIKGEPATPATPDKAAKPAKADKPDENGLNVEGLSAFDQRLWIGLRAPSVPGRAAEGHAAYIVSVDANAVFVTGQPLNARLHAVRLGADRGIRDMAALDDGRIVILSGPRTNLGTEFAIEVYDPRNGSLVRGTTLPRPENDSWKAEGLLVLSEVSNKIDLLVLHDGPKNGGPYEVSITKPTRASSAATVEWPCKGRS